MADNPTTVEPVAIACEDIEQKQCIPRRFATEFAYAGVKSTSVSGKPCTNWDINSLDIESLNIDERSRLEAYSKHWFGGVNVKTEWENVFFRVSFSDCNTINAIRISGALNRNSGSGTYIFPVGLF